jgi:uncharacterized delta-60 repeat protein
VIGPSRARFWRRAADVAIAIAGGAILLTPASARAKAGDPDPTFGASGKVTTAIGTSDAAAYAVAIQTDGKIVAAGETLNGATWDFALLRYQANGALDSTFGVGGKVATAVGTGDDSAYAVAVQSDGKLVVGGEASNGVDSDFALLRYNTNGTLDATFGMGGKVTTAVGTSDEYAYALAIQSDGKLVAVGETNTNGNWNFAVVRYNANGTLDSTFGVGGKVTTPVGTRDDAAYALAIQPDGKILVTGETDAGSNYDVALVRYNTNGTLDSTFGAGGKVTTPIGSRDDTASAVAVLPDGKIVVAGDTAASGDNHFALARYTPSGTLDSSFGTGGKVTTIFGTLSFLYAMAVQADQKLVVAGETLIAGTTDFALARYNPNGTLDATFGNSGTLATAIGTGDDAASALAIQSDGKIVAAGEAEIGTNLDAALVRYLASTCGNAIVEPGEACDDGDLMPGDGCSATCTVEPDWTCGGSPSVCTRTTTTSSSTTTTTSSSTSSSSSSSSTSTTSSTSSSSSTSTSSSTSSTSSSTSSTTSSSSSSTSSTSTPTSTSSSTTTTLASCGDDIVSQGEQCDGNGLPACADAALCVECACRDLGDCLVDGNIDLFDVLEKIDITLGRRTPSEAQALICDDNCDATIDLFDVLSGIDVTLGRTPLPLTCP